MFYWERGRLARNEAKGDELDTNGGLVTQAGALPGWIP
jgi:hypothetical protein